MKSNDVERKMNRLVQLTLAVVIGILWSTASFAAPINLINPATLSTTELISFDDVPTSNSGTPFAGIYDAGAMNFAERFSGQTLSVAGDWDVLSGLPSGPLTLAVGFPTHNLAIGSAFFSSIA